jgi:hypothetical protein
MLKSEKAVSLLYGAFKSDTFLLASRIVCASMALEHLQAFKNGTFLLVTSILCAPIGETKFSSFYFSLQLCSA